ncbi:hypothetical protein SAMN05216302_10272 [Nitrosomonas aestuarii]|uniref:Baseplate J-like protein n=1 Tax=Nitrosomonas aestuarii TaxID=52441 RepID=A0A1I4EBW6_9PROT|nr:hypothetical protein [Nitrosomonas aestuarii]SFL02679.1 hypothetical protein SAMN05216302_10272 [Nitrosomonas aestuarii]
MLTKSDFKQAIEDSIGNYPAAAPFYQAGDPRVLQHIDAMATMLAMFSNQIETAMAEPFEKTRDATVKADAAMRGVISKAKPARVRVLVTNDNSEAFAVDIGRVVIDSDGLPYIVETAVVVPAGDTGTFEATQVSKEALSHTVSGSVPFYPVEVPESTDDSYLSGIAVSDVDGGYEYRERYVNTLSGERVFHVEADDRQRIYVRFGQDGIVGVQPVDGDVITLTISRSFGDISPASGAPFSFEYLQSPLESLVTLTLDALVQKGQNPPDITTLRDLVRYPSVYNHNAVFLGEFDFVVRREYSNTQFLSVWNETVEEAARGASVDNINTLFVACLSAEGGEAVLTEPDPNTPVDPSFISEESLTATQTSIKNVILRADNSYRVKFVTPVRSEIAVTVTATVSAAYVVGDVRSKIIETILSEYGESQPGSSRGGNKPLHKNVYSLLKNNITALSDANADIRIVIADPVGNFRPELWRYVTEDSLTVTVTAENVLPPAWGNY